MTFLIQQTMIYAVPLMIVALAGVFAERSGIINLALEGIMILGAFIGVLFVNIMQTNHVYDAAKAAGDWVALQGFELLAMLVAAIFGAIFSLLLSFASVNLRADQTIGGTALNLMAPALVLFLIRIIANQNTLQMATGDAASWFMIKKTTLGYAKTDDLGFLGNTFLHKVYLATYICIIIFVVLAICSFFFVAPVMIFGNWKPLNIAGASLLFGLFKCIAAAYSSLDINGDGVYWLAEIGISSHVYRMLPYLITLVVLAFTSKKSRAPKAEGIPYDKGQR